MWRLKEKEIHLYDQGVSAIVESLQATGRVLEVFDPNHSAAHFTPSTLPFTLAIIPGAFAKEFPEHDARGQRIVEAAQELGLTAEIIEVPSFCSPSVGARYVAEWLEGAGQQEVLLVSLSKGSADAASFFSNPEYRSSHSRIRGWISIGGLLSGTPIINRIHSHPLARLYVAAALRLKGYRYSDLLTLRWSRQSLPEWNANPALSIPIVNVYGIPRYQHLSSPLAIRAVKRALRYGVSDGGGVLLGDLHRYQGSFVLVKDRDHYFRDVPIKALLVRLLFWVREANGANHA